MEEKTYKISDEKARRAFQTLRQYCNERKIDCNACQFKGSHCISYEKWLQMKKEAKNGSKV